MKTSIGKNIKRLRKQHGVTQKELGIALGFKAESADVRIAQYESGARTPRAVLLCKFADFFSIDVAALTASDMEVYFQLLHSLDYFEELCRQALSEINDIRAGLCAKEGGAVNGHQVPTNHRSV